MKKVGVILILIFCVYLIAPIKVNAEAKTLGDLRKVYEDLVAKKNSNDKKVKETKEQIAAREKDITEAELGINKAEEEHEEAERQIKESNDRIVELKSEAEKVLAFMQQIESNNAYVEYVTGSSSMTELVTRIEAVKQVTSYIQKTVDDLHAEIKKNEELKIELEKKKKALEEEIVKYQEVIKKYYANLSEYDKYGQDIDSQIKVAKENYELNKDMCYRNLGKTNDSLLLTDCSKVPVNGGWLKPTQTGYITSTIGMRWGNYHNALDIGVAEGTNLYPAAAGRVVATYYHQSCGGNEVFIYSIVNGVAYTHYYYHLLDYNVKVGDVVDQNTLIGHTGGGYRTSANTGGYDRCTTGAHLHYGVATGYHTSHVTGSAVMTPPPCYPNREGYSWSTRTACYK